MKFVEGRHWNIDVVFESTGRRAFAYQGECTLSPFAPGVIGYGYGGRIALPRLPEHAGAYGRDDEHRPLTVEERREVAAYMTALWKLWAETDPKGLSEDAPWPPEGFVVPVQP